MRFCRGKGEENFFSTKKFRVKECRVDDVWPGHEGRRREGERRGGGERGREGREKKNEV